MVEGLSHSGEELSLPVAWVKGLSHTGGELIRDGEGGVAAVGEGLARLGFT